MSMSRTSLVASTLDHFEPDESLDPQAQRRLRGHLEQIDYTAFAASKAAVGHVLGTVPAARIQRLAVVAAQARAHWVSAALAIADQGREPTPAELAELTRLRASWDEMAQAYEGLRRMVGRGYVAYGG
jgi:hypothetical protein